MVKQSSMSKLLFGVGRFDEFALAAAGLGAAIGFAVIFFLEDRLFAAIVALVLGLGWGAVVCSLAAIVSLLYRVAEHHQDQAGAWRMRQDGMRRQEAILQQMSEGIMISDKAKEVVSRNRDRELMKNAIQDDIAKKDWEAAYQLLEQMQSRFGYSREAGEFRRLVDSQRANVVQAVIEETREQVESLCANLNWSEAQAMLDSLTKQFPNNRQVRKMAEEMVGQKRGDEKKQLLASWDQAVENRPFVDRLGVPVLLLPRAGRRAAFVG